MNFAWLTSVSEMCIVFGQVALNRFTGTFE